METRKLLTVSFSCRCFADINAVHFSPLAFVTHTSNKGFVMCLDLLTCMLDIQTNIEANRAVVGDTKVSACMLHWSRHQVAMPQLNYDVIVAADW
jgi:hypothetical protein